MQIPYYLYSVASDWYSYFFLGKKKFEKIFILFPKSLAMLGRENTDTGTIRVRVRQQLWWDYVYITLNGIIMNMKNFYTFILLASLGTVTIAYVHRVKVSNELISAQRTLIDSQREYISTADELIEIQNQLIELQK